MLIYIILYKTSDIWQSRFFSDALCTYSGFFWVSIKLKMLKLRPSLGPLHPDGIGI